MWALNGELKTQSELVAAFPNVSFPRGFDDWEQYGAERVEREPFPGFSHTDELTMCNKVERRDGRLFLVWERRPFTPEERQKIVSDECRRRIYDIADETAQINLAAAAGADFLTPEQFQVWKAGLQWVAAMRAQYKTIFGQGLDPYDDANWPAVPAGVAELGAAF